VGQWLVVIVDWGMVEGEKVRRAGIGHWGIGKR